MSRKLKWQLVGGNIRKGQLTRQDKGMKRNFSWLSMGLVLIFSWLISRAFFLQIVLGSMNRQLADSNRIETRQVPADRAVIIDRHGEVLARNGLNQDGKPVREYPVGEAVSSVVGYVGNPSAGVEKSFNEHLQGIPGEDIVEENARGQQQQVLRQREPEVAEALQLSIDKQLQEKIAEILRSREVEKGNTTGAVVITKAQTGEVLALTSWPSYDNNLFSGLKSRDIYRYDSLEEVLGDTLGKPLFNRAVSGAYPPGSVYKLITAVAGLEEEKIDEMTLVDDTGELKVGDYRYGNWYFDRYGRTEGSIGVVKALARSNDIYFYKVGEWVGIDKLAEWSRKFGLGAVTGISLPSEVSGAVPDRMKKERLTGERWFLGNTYHVAIGQGDTLVSPLQMNMFTAAAVTGKLCRPMIVASEQLPVNSCKDLGISQQTREIVLEGMKAVCSSGGTAFSFFNTTYKAACKTGTAQHGGEETLPHSWISVVLPRGEVYEKGVVITVLLEEAGEGSEEAGPVAKEIADYLYSKRLDFDL